MIRHVLAMAVLTGCVLPPKTVSVQMRRGPIWAQPGSPQVFAWSFRETQKTQKSFGEDQQHNWAGDREVHWHNDAYTVIDRTHPTVVDPVSGTTIKLADYDHEVQPVYWDTQKQILWVVENSGSGRGLVVGLAPSGVVGRGMFGYSSELPMPFLRDATGRGKIYNMATGETLSIDNEAGAGVGAFDGSILRLTRISFTLKALLIVEQTVVDWSHGAPQRMADVRYQGPELPELDAQREAINVMPDGRRVVEVVTSRSAGTQLYIHDLATRQIDSLPVGSLQPPDSYSKPKLYPLGPNTLAYLVAERHGDEHCYRGSTISLTTHTAVPVPAQACISTVSGRPGRAWLEVGDRSGYVGDDGKIKSFGMKLPSPLELGPTTIAFPREAESGGVDVDSFDFATGTFTRLGHHASRSDTLLNVNPGQLTFVSGADKIVTELGDAKPVEYTLPPVGN